MNGWMGGGTWTWSVIIVLVVVLLVVAMRKQSTKQTYATQATPRPRSPA